MSACRFLSFCPPDIQPNSRIIALCGANDWHDNASPRRMDTFPSSNQLWLTCLDPKILVRSSDRRVVLDEVSLDRIEVSKNICVIPLKDLLERFLATISSETQIAVRENQPILVIVFGHGKESNFGVAIGAHVRITISPTRMLSISGMAAVNDNETNRAWTYSQSCGRAASSVYATVVFNALVNMSKMSSLNKEQDPFYSAHGISFSAQDDKWHLEWRTRSGLSLLEYEKKWKELREVSSIQFLEEPCESTGALGFTGSIGRGYHNVVKAKARAYMDSFPSPDNIAAHNNHWQLRQLLRGEKYPEEILSDLNDTLDYSLSAMTLASQYVSLLDIQFSECHMFDTETWRNDLAWRLANDSDSEDANSRQQKFNEYLPIIFIESSLSIDKTHDRIHRLVKFKEGAQRFLITMPLAEAMMNDDNVVRQRDRFFETVEEVRTRLRSSYFSQGTGKSLPS
ncbi:hypothetical protein BDV25DRAFT_172643 [Aspergillus avenaceus]|uniref:Uncharacterized protein n=1 Tax=Aspergillus avenaceus TaxID=36643 RepID=A0A5N6U6R0_ASPAV|nr:hypothetical protein BDV25DRAFT_172643 [Aspergillus avenaceus]